MDDDDTFVKVKDNTEINDIRPPPQFKGITFSNFKKTDVRKQLLDNLSKGRIEPSCYWSAEFICAGHYGELWEIILYYIGKHIHLGNPKIILYLENRYNIFRNIMSQGQFLNELQLRNHPNIRNLFAEVICVIATSNKKNSLEPIKINRVEEFDITQMSEKLHAPNIQYVDGIFRKDDPKELFIAMNEFAYNISTDRASMLNACYWIEWTIDFEAICKKRKVPCKCETRGSLPVENKFKTDAIWLIWDIIMHYSSILNNNFIDRLIHAVKQAFCIKYTTASCKKRRYLLYFAIALLTEHVPTNIEINNNKQLIQTVIGQINMVYKQIKKNEHSPNTEYLFANLERENTFEISMRKMELVNSMDFMSRKST